MKIGGLTLRYPASTALALACAADKLAWEATKQKDRQRAARYAAARDSLLEPFGGRLATGVAVELQRAAIEQLRTSKDARVEARAAVMKRYADKGLPQWGWTVHGFGRLIPMIEPVELREDESNAGDAHGSG